MMQQALPSATDQQIVVGKYSYQTGYPQGGLVHFVTAVRPTAIPQPIPIPVTIRPRPFRQLLGREDEMAWVTNLLQQQIHAEFYSEPGMGKTILLRHLTFHPITNQFPDGVIYLATCQESVEDILHALYTAFYQSASPHKPTEGNLRHSLQAKNALIVLDDFDLGREELDMLLNAAPTCTFLIASVNRALWGDGESRALVGLQPEHALALLERDWERPLTTDEQTDAQTIIALLKGHPLRLQQTITAAREQHLSLRDVVARLQGNSTGEQINLFQLRQQLVAAFDDDELQDLCFDLGVNYENLPAQGKLNKVRELIEVVTQNGRLSDLFAKCTTLRPYLNWGEPTQAIVDPSINTLPTQKRDILSVLAAFGDKPLSAELISQLVGQADVWTLLEELMQRGLVQNTEYHLAGSLPYRFHSDLEPMLLFVVEWASEQAAQNAGVVLRREAKTLAFLQQWAVTNGHPAEALQLGRLLDEVLALDGRWGLWQQVLLTAQQAAQAAGDQVAEAWTLNQLGCRALCLGEKGVARIQLKRAKKLNEAIGNEAGTAVNDHNLGILRGVPVKQTGWRRLMLFFLVAVALLVMLGWWLKRTAVTPANVSTTTATSAPAVLPTETLSPPETSVPTQTAVPSATDTLPPTVLLVPTVATETAVPVTETAPATTTSSPIATPSLTATLTKTPTPSGTPTSTQTPTHAATLTLTPSPTNTRWPTPLPTFTPGPFTQPDLISPDRGSSHRTNITFQWRGNLQSNQQYRVQLRHTDSGFTLSSPLLNEPIWATILPAERFGEWHWEVSVVSGNLTHATSDNWHFYLDPFPHSSDRPTVAPTNTIVPPTPTPTGTATLSAPG